MLLTQAFWHSIIWVASE